VELMIAEDLMRKYKYGYIKSCSLLEEEFVKDLLKESKQLKRENKELEILVECLKLGVTLNRKQEKLLDKVLFSKEVK